MQDNDARAFMVFFSAFAGVLIALIVTRYYARTLRSREIIKALEMGQELPMKRPAARSFLTDLRTGVLLICLAIGFALFVWIGGGGRVAGVALVPLFVGIGFIITAFLIRRFGPEEILQTEIPPPTRASTSDDLD